MNNKMVFAVYVYHGYCSDAILSDYCGWFQDIQSAINKAEAVATDDNSLEIVAFTSLSCEPILFKYNGQEEYHLDSWWQWRWVE